MNRLPERQSLWPLYGVGFESLGLEGRPVEAPMPAFGPDELLVRHDACGICYSDVKVIRAGGEHPRLYGRDLHTGHPPFHSHHRDHHAALVHLA